MKYWVLSFKMEEITNGSQVKNLDIKAKVLFYILIVFTIGALIFYAIEIRVTYVNKGVRWSGFIPSLPPAICLLVLFDAFIRMKRCEGIKYSLSNS
jgi:hypothetical protein